MDNIQNSFIAIIVRKRKSCYSAKETAQNSSYELVMLNSSKYESVNIWDVLFTHWNRERSYPKKKENCIRNKTSI